MTITNRALRGDPKLLPLIINLDREISAAQERDRVEAITENMTPQEAMKLFQKTLHR